MTHRASWRRIRALALIASLVAVTVHTATGAIDYGAVGCDGAPPQRLVPSGPFRAAIDRAYTEAFDPVRKPADLGRDYVFETPWTFVLR